MKNRLAQKALDDLNQLVKAERVEMVRRLQRDLADAIRDSVAKVETAPRAGAGAPVLSAQHLELVVRQAAVHFSEMRRISQLFHEHRQRLQDLRSVPSTPDDMLNDWFEACAFVALEIIESAGLDFEQVAPASYPLLEDVWLQRIKRLKAYYVWKTQDTGDRERNYHVASESIRRLLLDRPRSPVSGFEKVRAYIEQRYLRDAQPDRLDDGKPATQHLIDQKARRIWQGTHDCDGPANWFRARLYVSLFYENIIGAVLDDDRRRTLNILKAFQVTKAPEHRYLIINGFETVVAINFLNKDIIREVLENPALYDYSLQPVSDWPADAPFPADCADFVRFDRDEKQLVCEGLLSEDQKRSLLAAFPSSEQRFAIEQLYQQSQLRPFADMIL